MNHAKTQLLASVLSLAAAYAAMPTSGARAECIGDVPDAIVDATEACDDGNIVDGDGCDSTCNIEAAEDWACARPASFVGIDTEDYAGAGGAWTTTTNGKQGTQTVNTGSGTIGLIQAEGFEATYTFRLRVDTTGDNDFIGIVLGFKDGDANSPAADFLLLDWKRGDQDHAPFGGIGKLGMALSRVQGIPTATNLWIHSGAVSEIARGSSRGTVGWDHETDYRFRVLYTPTLVRVKVGLMSAPPETDITEFALTPEDAGYTGGVFPDGDLGFFGFSQPQGQYELEGPFGQSTCNRPPTVESFAVTRSVGDGDTTIAVGTGFTDPDGNSADPGSVTIVSGPATGSATPPSGGAPDGTVVVATTPDEIGTQTVTYQLCDDHPTKPLCHTGTIVVTTVCAANADCAIGEVCDLTEAPATCEPADTCGNGTLEAGEGCDDGDNVADAACTADCKIVTGQPCNSDAAGDVGDPSCQSGSCDAGTDTCVCEVAADCPANEVCDTTNNPNACEPAATCGNGNVEAGEGCDDGDTVADAACTADCKIVTGQPCTDDDACASGSCDAGTNTCACEVDADCPANEVCDTTNDPNACEPADTCGNGTVETGEGCDDGDIVADAACTADCKIPAGQACVTGGPGAQGDESCASNDCDTATNTCVCVVDGDCETGFVCNTDETPAACEPAASCTDAIQNGTETDVDCGGPACPACEPGEMCASIADGTDDDASCTTNECTDGICVANPVLNDDTATITEDTPVLLNVIANDPAGIAPATVTQPANGTVTIEPDGTLLYTPNADFVGTDTFTYEVCVGQACSTATVVITVEPANDAPVASPDSVTTPTDTPVTVNVAANDSDPEGGAVTVTAVGQPGNGTAEVDDNGMVVYTPTAGFVGTDTVTYTVCDPEGLCSEGTLTVIVGVDNGAPLAVDDTATATEDGGPITVDVKTNDSDPDGEDLTVTAVSAPLNGTATLEADGTVTYEPNPDFAGIDTFTYTICDESGACGTATVTVDVTAVNDAPVAVDDVMVTVADTAVTADLAANDVDVDGDTLTVTTLVQPVNGTVVIDTEGTVTYTPNAGFSGEDTYSYTVCDSDNACDTAEVTVNVAPGQTPNTAPVATDDVFTVPADAPATLDVLANDTDAEGDDLHVAAVTQPENGTVTIAPDGQLVFTPTPGFNGPVTFTYQACDSTGQCDEAVVTLTVGNQPPEVKDYEATTDEDTPVIVAVLEVATDPDGDELSVGAVVAEPTNGTVTINDDGTVTYVPDPNFNGVDVFKVSICDPSGACATQTVSVTVNPVNDAPVANPDAATTPQEQAVTVDVGANDGDADGDVMTVTEVEQPANGTATVEADGTVTYTPNDGFTGTDTVPYTVCDPSGACAQGNLVVTVGSDNGAPVAVDDNIVVAEGADATVVDVKGNDNDPEGDTLTVDSVTDPANGTAEVQDDGTVVYAPDPGFSGDDSFVYTICDDAGACASATVNVTVTGVDSLPTAVGDTVFTLEDTPVTFDPRTNDVEPDGEALTIKGASEPSNGTVTVNDDGTITYTPNDGFTGIDSFEVEVCDPQDNCDTQTVTVFVDPVPNTAPNVVDDAATTPKGVTAVINVLANDSDPEGDDIAVTEVTQPANGTVTLNGDGSVTYTPNDDFVGTDTFTVVVCDDHGNCDSSTVTVTVTTDNVGPTVVDDAIATDFETPVTFDPRANDSDPEGGDLTVKSVSTAPANGTAVVNDDGTVTYTPNEGFEGTDSFTVEVCDAEGLCDESEVTVTVGTGPTNGPPVVNDDVASGVEGEPVKLWPTANDTDPDGDVLTVSRIVTEPANGSAVVNDDGTVTYTPDAGFEGTDTFTIEVCDTAGNCAESSVTVEVGPRRKFVVTGGSCAGGEPASGWPLLAALLGLVVMTRRRRTEALN